MADELENMEKLLGKTPIPAPDDGVKNAAISKAMAAFDEKTTPARQGTSVPNRLMDTVRDFHNTIFGGHFMKKAYLVAGGVCAAALTITLLNTTIMTDLMPGRAMNPQPAPVITEGETPVTTAPVAEPAKEDANEQVLATVEKDAAPPADLEAVVGPQPTMVAPASPMGSEGAYGGSKAKSSFMGQAELKKAPAGIIAGVQSDLVVVRSDLQRMPQYHDEGRDKFQDIKVNPVKVAKDEPVSTFSVDVDTSSYSFMRASLNNNVLPQKDAVRIEEMINYFPYNYATPQDKSEPFKATVAVFPTPWNKDTKLVHVGIKGYQIEQKEKPHSNLVFLLDTSGSMDEPNKLPLLRNSMKLLLDSLQPDDSVAIVTYAGSAGTVLEPTKVQEKGKILAALDNLDAGGSTAGAEGIRQAYELAKRNFDKNGVNRVILATDGDFNVGITSEEELKSYIERERESGIFLSVLGFGQGNYNDALMQTLAQNGNGNAAYIDNLNEARKALVEEAGSTLFTIAKDVKIQVEFNPATVAEYRLIGYENRMLNREDFNNDKVDAGDIGAGHAVTAIYEITPVGSGNKLVDDLRYQQKPEADSKVGDEYAFLKIRYKLPESSTSKLITTPVDSKVEFTDASKVPTDTRFAAAVAGFGELLRGDPYTKSLTYDEVITMAEGAKGEDKFGYRAEFINLVRLAKHASGMPTLQQGQ